MNLRLRRRWAFYIAMIGTVAVMAVIGLSATGYYRKPFPGVLLDADGVVSSLGLPSWPGFRQGLAFPDRLVSVGNRDLSGEPGKVRAKALDSAAERAGQGGLVHACFETRRQPKPLCVDLPVQPLSPLAWWLFAGMPLIIGAAFVAAGVTALLASPRGRLSRTFAFSSAWYALFLFTLFDYHTSRLFVPLFHLAYAIGPLGCFILPLRLPDDAAVLERRRWLVPAAYGVGVSLAAALLVAHAVGASTVGLRNVCAVLLGVSFIFFASAILYRFARAKGPRRKALRMLVGAMVPAHAPIGVAFLLALAGIPGSTTILCALPLFLLSPLATFLAFIRYNLWGSRRVLPRIHTRMALAAAGGVGGIVVAAILVAWLGDVPFKVATLGATAGATVAAVLVTIVLNAGDRSLFPARAEYKPTVEQLSAELLLMSSPEGVASAVERTVRRWLPCEVIEFRTDLSEPPEDPDATNMQESGYRPAVTRRSELYLDVMWNGVLLGQLHLGGKPGGALFTSEDIDLLRTIANLAALAMAHARSYAELEQRRREQAAAWHNERVALVETVAAEIAHEVRYPINFFRSIFSRKKDRLDEEEIDIGCEEVERLERLVSGLRKVVSTRIDRRSASVADLASKVEMLLRDQLGPRRLVIETSGPLTIRCDPDQATQILVNLVSNAIDAAGDDGEVGICWSGGGARGTLTVWDTGSGFSCEPGQLFAPWFTTKKRGTGLGLAIAHRIVRAHGWSIDPERREGVTRFVITIPKVDVLDTPPSFPPHAVDEPTAEAG
ncbi:MAG: HAMP domain-containing histidine kinase [Polyangiaceae bacterium]|nr:HAMP domain-containing histidine kinase [Polyangiaceae bacterium]